MRAARADVELSDVNEDARFLGGRTCASGLESKPTDESCFVDDSNSTTSYIYLQHAQQSRG